MYLDQRIGPFTSGEAIFDEDNVTYLQIGIERPHSIPISEIELSEDDPDNSWPVIIGINRDENNSKLTQKDFVVSEKDILEFRLNHERVKVFVWETVDPYIIINIAYEITH